MDNETLGEFFTITCTKNELYEFLKEEPRDEGTYIFLLWMLKQFEDLEKYEMCQIVKDEIDNRIEEFNIG